MIPPISDIIFVSVTLVAALMVLTTTLNGETDYTTKVALRIAFIYAVSLIYGMIKQILAWGTALALLLTIASISFSVLCVIKRRLLDRHVEDLGVAVAKLHRMETALCHLGQIPFAKQTSRWLKSVGDVQRRAQDNKAGYDRCGLNYSEMLYLSRRARQELNIASDLLRQGDSLLRPHDQFQGTMNFYRKKVIGFIKSMDDDAGLLGIWGMGGVGKTSLLELLVGDSRSEYDNGSLEVLFVHAGTGCTVGQVQEAIATSMGLSITHNATSQARIIHDHLTDTSFLLMLDDLWGYIDLKAVGVPLPLGRVIVSPQGGLERKARRKVALTTRNMGLCHKMGCSRDNTIQMECFDEEDAWNVFRRGWPIRKVDDDMDKLLEVLPARASSSSRHTRRQLATRQPYTVSDDAHLHRPQYNQMSSYEKMCYFIEDKDAKSLLLGVWGIRGAGKTTLLRLARRDSYKFKAGFDHILLVGAGTGHTVNNVQHAIAINLGLDIAMMSSMDELSRAMCIFHYLQHKSFLLLLDDIREPLNWWAIGLPLLHWQQKIILATRSQAACALMGCETVNTIEMECLGRDAAWCLFRGKAGLRLIDNHPQVHHLANQMVSRCGGLPLAICSLGRAMSSRRDPREWRSAYRQLTDMRLKPCEIDEKVGTLILNPPYGWKGDTNLPHKQIAYSQLRDIRVEPYEVAIEVRPEVAIKVFPRYWMKETKDGSEYPLSYLLQKDKLTFGKTSLFEKTTSSDPNYLTQVCLDSDVSNNTKTYLDASESKKVRVN